MNIYADISAAVASILQPMIADGRLPENLDLQRFVVEPTKDPAHGDLACNAAMVYAKDAKSAFGAPRAFAEAIAQALRADARVAAVEIAGPGFINIRLQPKVLADVLRASLAAGANFGRAGALRAKKINVEYVSANPTGPMHVGHGRGAVFGDALAGLLEFAGHKVTREYYINDAGAQVDKLAQSAVWRYREALGEPQGPLPDDCYPGDYLAPVGAALAKKYGRALLEKPQDEWFDDVRVFVIDAMMDAIREDLRAINITHEIFYSERALTRGPQGDRVGAAIDDLKAKDLVYVGRLPPPKGQLPDDWEDREQTLFRSTQFGDDVDRPLLKSDGGYTYFASDIAYHREKIARGYDVLIDVWGADHGGYVKRMDAAVQALSGGATELDVKLCQLVNLMRDGEPVKMSKRSGSFVTLREVVDEVGVDAVRFMMLYRKNDATLEFDLAKVLEQSKDNPVFYVQYAHARAKSVWRKAREAFPGIEESPAALAKADLALLTDDAELGIIRQIAQFPRMIGQASEAHEPHRLAFYLHDLASLFHSYWNKGKDAPQLRFVNQDARDLTCARLALVTSLTSVLATGLGILGVSAPDEMR